MAECTTPYMVEVKGTGTKTPVPCGKCLNCKARRASAWSFRLMEEDRVSSSAYFLTLTYDTEKVPISRNGFMDLRKRDLQTFFKRLRINLQRRGITLSKPLKYYAVGEYGGKSQRPHYHIILFNFPVELVKYVGLDKSGNKKFTSNDIVSAWKNGGIDMGQVSQASVGYTLKYISKDSQVPKHRNDDRLREFSLMSKNLAYHI